MIKVSRNMNKHMRIVLMSVYSLMLFIPALFVRAGQDQGTDPGSANQISVSSKLPNPLSSGINSFPEFVKAILNIVLQIGVPIAAVAIIYSGFLFLKAQGNDDELKTAKSALTWSVVGTAVLLGSWVFAQAISATITALQ